LSCFVSYICNTLTKRSMKDNEKYSVVVFVPRRVQTILHNEQARRRLAGKKQTVAEIASELLTSKAEEAQGDT